MCDEPERGLESYARELVFLQHALIRRLMLKFDWRPSSELLGLGELPRYGTVEEPTTIWGFSQHGLGIRFINIRNLACVDIEDCLHDSEVFTPWRLQIFIESVGGSDAAMTVLGNRGPEALEQFATPVVGTADHYRLRGPMRFSTDGSNE